MRTPLRSAVFVMPSSSKRRRARCLEVVRLAARDVDADLAGAPLLGVGDRRHDPVRVELRKEARHRLPAPRGAAAAEGAASAREAPAPAAAAAETPADRRPEASSLRRPSTSRGRRRSASGRAAAARIGSTKKSEEEARRDAARNLGCPAGAGALVHGRPGALVLPFRRRDHRVDARLDSAGVVARRGSAARSPPR